MSSFEPDRSWVQAAGFRPAGPADRSEAGFRPERGALPRGGAAKPAEAPACTPAQHAALEAAAFEKGQQAAMRDEARCEQACAVLEQAAHAWARVSLRQLYENREATLVLAAEIARHWLGEELRLDPARCLGPLERALSACADAQAARLALHPDVLAALETSQPERLARWSERLPIELVTDAALAPGAFRIETATQTVDAGLDSLVARLREALASAFAAPGPDAEEVAC